MHPRALVLQFILLVSLSACGDQAGRKSLDLSDPHWIDDFNVVLSVTSDGEKVTFFAIARGIPDLDFLSINGDTIPVTIYYDEDRDFSYFYYGNSDTVFGEIAPGVPFDFEMATGGVLYSGSLTMPQELSVEWPWIFVTDQDFEFWWQTAKDPDAFIVTATLYDFYYDEIDYDVWQVDGDRRSFAIARSFFRGYSEEEVSFEADIEPTNFSVSGDFVVIGTSDYEYYESSAQGHSKVRKFRDLPGFPDGVDIKRARSPSRAFSIPR